MRNKFSIVATTTMILLISVSPSISASNVPDEQYAIPAAPNSTDVGVLFLDSLFPVTSGYLAADAAPETSMGLGLSSVSQDLCKSITDSICTAGASISYTAHFPNCRDSSDIDCVVGVYALKPDGTRVDGVFQHGLPDSPSTPFDGDGSVGIPRSGVDGVWTLPGIVNGGGSDSYLVTAIQSGGFSKAMGAKVTQRIDPTSFGAAIVPIKEISGSYTVPYVGVGPSPNGTMRLRYYSVGGSPNADSCAGVSTSVCAQRESFPPDITFGLSLRMSGEIKGWLQGRISDPKIEYKFSSTGTSISVEASPVRVPIVAAWTSRDKLPAVVPGSGGVITPGTALAGSSSADFSIDLLKIWLPLVGDKAQANPTAWSFGNLPYSNLPGANACLFDSKSLAGFVSTNSTVYSPGPPAFNTSTQSLDYKLASPHFTSTGEVFKGTYNLVIRSDVARCIYKFTNAPIKATISVTDESGDSSVAVESMTERDGWIYLSASNFTFSSPTVHVKLIGTPISLPTPTPSPRPSATVTSSIITPEAPIATKSVESKKLTITCVKGKITKKVTAIKPTCPTGWKKKV